MRWWSPGLGFVVLLAVATPTSAQDGGPVGVGAAVTISYAALGESVNDRLEFVRGMAGSLNVIAERLDSPSEGRTDGAHHAWVSSLALRLSTHLERREATLAAPGRTLATIRDEWIRLDDEFAAFLRTARAEAAAFPTPAPAAVVEVLASNR